MERQKRIRVVVVSAVALLSLLMALFGAPLIAVTIWPIPAIANDGEAFIATFAQAARAARTSTTISLVSLAIAGGCVIYLLVVLAAWFVGPKERSAERAS
jgi:formate/nitrite transporter FocA (FNT family)